MMSVLTTSVLKSFGQALGCIRQVEILINKPGKLTGSEIKLYFDCAERKLSGVPWGVKRGAILRKIVALRQENSSTMAGEPPLKIGVHPRPYAVPYELSLLCLLDRSQLPWVRPNRTREGPVFVEFNRF